MNHFKHPIAFLLMAGVLFITSCQPSNSDDQASAETSDNNTYSNEIPVNSNSEDAMAQFEKGLAIYDQGNNQKAKAYFDKAIELDPDFVSAYMYRAFCANTWQEWSEKRDNVLAMRDKANEGEQLMMDIIVNNMEGDAMKDLDLNQKLADTYPKSARACDMLAGSYDGLNDTEKARELWSKAMELNPDYIPAITNLGLSYLFTSPKDLSKATELMTKVVEKAPNSSRAQIDLGDCHRAQNDLEKALVHYTKAAELDPSDQVAHSKAGHANSFLGNFDDARKNFQDARGVSEYGTDSYNFEAFTYLYEGDHAMALSFLKDAVNQVNEMEIPESSKTGTNMGNLFACAMIAMHHGDAEELKSAVEMMKPLSTKMGEEAGSNSVVRNQQANMQYWDAVVSAMQGDYGGAAEMADMINTTLESSTDPDKMERYHRVHAIVNYQQENYEQAMEHLSKLDPDNTYDQYWVAKTHQMLGNTDQAMDVYKSIADFNFNGVGYALIRNEVKDLLASATS